MKDILNFLKIQYSNIYKFFLLVVTIALIVFFFPKVVNFKYDYQQGKPWMYSDLIAPYDFPIYKTQETLKEERQEALKDLEPYFRYNADLTEARKSRFEEDFRKQWLSAYGDTSDTYRVNRDFAMGVLDSILQQGIIKMTETLKERPGNISVILIRDKNAEKRPLSSFFTIRQADEAAESMVYDETPAGQELKKDFIYRMLQDALPQNVEYEEDKTRAAREQLLQNVSITRGMVQKGERIIARGEVVTPKKYQVLSSFEKDYKEQVASGGNLGWVTAGQAIVIGILMLVLFLFYYFFRQSLFEENKKIIFIFFIMLLMVMVNSLFVKYNAHYLYVIPITIVPLLIRIFFDARLAIVIHLITVLLIGFFAPESFNFVILNVVAGMIAIMSIVQIHRRGQFFLTSLWVFLAYAVTYAGIALMQGEGLQSVEYANYGLFAGNAILTLFAYPLIYIFERTFSMVTDVTLLELSDTNTPLLRKLLARSPGTFQHSMQVANLAEEAIREIGGNALLVRAGALYHDIGKMDMPIYFIENQKAGINPHDELTYEESARIIVSHVIKGVEMAKRKRLPEQIIDFIRTHHGTRRADYFYIKQKQENPEEQVDEKTFSYQGPIPFSKETAVLMMADSAEAASRSINAPDENKINNLVDSIVDKLFEENQLNNADITLKDIHTVKKVLKRQLMNIYHVRIAYPE
ncbi:MAG: HDIG domain-containing protein [Bacteroidales bacterium]|nr:HDIG domain-containing protein [Bacteroidales bacterium]